MKKIAVLAALAVVMSVAAPGQATSTTTKFPPFTRGTVCWKASTYYFFWTFSCYADPPIYGFLPSVKDPGAPFNYVAATARNGELVTGALHPQKVYKSSTSVDFIGSAVVGDVSATAIIKESVFGISKFCVRIWDLGPLVGSATPVLLTPECNAWIGGTVFSDTWTVTAAGVAANRRMRVEVLLDNSDFDGASKVKVESISYTLP